MAEFTSKTSKVAHAGGGAAIRRKDLRVAGPFEGRWIGALSVPVHIHDLSAGGCLIQAFHEQAPGRRFTLEIDLPYHGWVTLEAESLYVRDGYGFAAKFLDVPDDLCRTLEAVIWRLLSKDPSEA